jgi:glycosyltransferase involved in cell wall biosynthesis
VQLILAGPVKSHLESTMIVNAQSEFGALVDYRGPVYNEDKRLFFQDMDVFVYPTRYDAQPLVITEALAFGRPTLSYGRGCIPGMIGPKSEWSIPPDGNFVESAARQIGTWIDDPQEFASARKYAMHRYDALISDAMRALENFVLWVRREACAEFVNPSKSNLVVSRN